MATTDLTGSVMAAEVSLVRVKFLRCLAEMQGFGGTPSLMAAAPMSIPELNWMV